MKAIVHIGSPKTGSSSIQTFLHLNSAELARRGVRYQRNVPHRGSQYEYPLAALARRGQVLGGQEARVRYKVRTIEEARANYLRAANGLTSWPTSFKQPVAVFSSEHFAPWIRSIEDVAEVDRMFGDVFSDVTYVLYLRRQEDLVASRYSERVKRGASVKMNGFVRRSLNSLDHFDLVQRWIQVVGPDRFKIRLMEKNFLTDGDLISDFCGLIGVDPQGLKQPPRVNEALSATGAEVMRRLNLRAREVHPEGGLNPARRGLLGAVRNVSWNEPKIQLTAELRSLVRNTVAQSNEALRADFFPDRPVLFEDKDVTTDDMTPDQLNDRALAVMTEIVLRQKLGRIKPIRRSERSRSVVKPDPSLPKKAKDHTGFSDMAEFSRPRKALMFGTAYLKRLIQT